MRAFYRWCREQDMTKNDPFAKYNGKTTERYGTPYYISIEERDKIADFDLSANPSLEAQRDIFIFQCLIGCRVSDLLAMTHDSIINGAIEYMPQKTAGERPQVVRVPLNTRALALVAKYKEREGLNGKLFPFISSQKYNVAIKKIFKTCGVTRMVTILNPSTGKRRNGPLTKSPAATSPDAPSLATSTRKSKTQTLSVHSAVTLKEAEPSPATATSTKI